MSVERSGPQTAHAPLIETAKPVWLQHVSPNKVNLAAIGGKEGQALAAQTQATLSGDWDLRIRAIPFTQLMPFRALAERFEARVPWEQTEYFEYARKRVDRDVQLGRVDPDQAEQVHRERLEDLDRLHESIAAGGYMEQVRLEPTMRRIGDEIKVAITRDGRYVFVDGRHRLSIARILGLPSVPVSVVARHEQWDAFRQHILREGEMNGQLYHTVDHPDIRDVPAHHRFDRVPLLEEALSGVERGSLLDVGANWGFYSQVAERLGFSTTGVEAIPKDADIATRFAVATESSYTIWQGDVSDFPDIERFDTVFLLNVLHHFLRSRERFERLDPLLRRIHAHTVIFEPNKAPMGEAYSDLFGEEFARYVADTAGFSTIDFIGHAADRRPVYRFRR